jgi:hypothetical protein
VLLFYNISRYHGIACDSTGASNVQDLLYWSDSGLQAIFPDQLVGGTFLALDPTFLSWSFVQLLGTLDVASTSHVSRGSSGTPGFAQGPNSFQELFHDYLVFAGVNTLVKVSANSVMCLL